MIYPDETYNKVQEKARDMGITHGKNSLRSWRSYFFDRHTGQGGPISRKEYAIEMLVALEEGGSKMEELPFCDLSGQWADAPTSIAVGRVIVHSLVPRYKIATDEGIPTLHEVALSAYSEAHDETVFNEAEKFFREIVLEIDPRPGMTSSSDIIQSLIDGAGEGGMVNIIVNPGKEDN